MRNIQSLNLEFPSTAISKQAIDFIQSFLTLDPAKRIKLEQIPKTAFIAKHIDYLQQFEFFEIDLPKKRKRKMRRNKKAKKMTKRQKINDREYIIID